MNKLVYTLDSRWLKAAIIGSIWAAVEIVAGTFLHNLRFPFAGTLLAASSVFLLVAFMQYWPERYIILRAGMICALMKSISPGAVILGPMVGIFTEALFLEVFRMLLGRNPAAYIIGGALAVSWSLVQKVLTWLILYGFDIVHIAEALYDFLVKLSGLQHVEASYLILLVFSLYILTGAAAAVSGYWQGRKIAAVTKTEPKTIKTSFGSEQFFTKNPHQRYSRLILLFLIPIVGFILYLLNQQIYIIAIPLGITFTAFVICRYGQSVRHLKKPSVWVQFMLITLIAAMLWEWAASGEYFSKEGLIIGLEMNFRAVIMIFGFASLSTELRNPVVENLLNNHGFARLYKALSIAFSALPVAVSAMPQVKNLWRQRKHILSALFGQADALLKHYLEQQKTRNNIFVLTGPLHSGKTSFAQRLVKKLKTNGLKVQGILAIGEFSEGKRSLFYQQDIRSGKKGVLAVTEKRKGWLKFSRYWFNPIVLEQGNRLLLKACQEKPDVLVLDEVGPMELMGQGRAAVLPKLLQGHTQLQIWVIRDELRERARVAWNLSGENFLDIRDYTVSELIAKLPLP